METSSIAASDAIQSLILFPPAPCMPTGGALCPAPRCCLGPRSAPCPHSQPVPPPRSSSSFSFLPVMSMVIGFRSLKRVLMKPELRFLGVGCSPTRRPDKKRLELRTDFFPLSLTRIHLCCGFTALQKVSRLSARFPQNIFVLLFKETNKKPNQPNRKTTRKIPNKLALIKMSM